MYLKTIISSALALLLTTVMAGCNSGVSDETASLQAKKLGFSFTTGSAVSVSENSTAVTTLNTTGGMFPVVYEISTGSDREHFLLDPESGVLTLREAADYEAPLDTNGNNIYNVTVAAIDGNGKRTRLALDVTVEDIDETEAVHSEIILEESAVTEESVVTTEPTVVEESVVTEEPVVAEGAAAAEEISVAEEPAVVEAPVVAKETPLCITGEASLSGRVLDSSSGSGVADVRVSIGGCTTTTDADGYYTLANIAAAEKAVVDFEHENYVRNSAVVQIDRYSEGTTSSSPNYLEYGIDAYDNRWSYDSQTSVAGAHIKIPAAVYADMAGNAYKGTVTAGLKIVDVTTDKGKALFPGAFEGQNSSGENVLFRSYGLINLSLEDASGNTLELAEGATATLTFDAVASLEAQNIIPLWYYDYDQGLWIEEGFAELQADGTYKGEVSHLGTWGLNVPLESASGIYRARMVYDNTGNPVRDARVMAVGPNWVRRDLSTDADGIFEIEVLPGDDFQLVAYNYKWKYEAKYSGTLSAIAPGDIVE